MRLRQRDDGRMKSLGLRPGEPASAAVGPNGDLEKASPERLVERRHLVLRRLRVPPSRRTPTAFGEDVLVQAARGQELQRGLLDVALCAIELFKQEEPGPLLRKHVRRRVFGASIADDGEPYEVRWLEQAEVQNDRADAELFGDAAHDLTLADTRRPFEEHGARRAR